MVIAEFKTYDGDNVKVYDDGDVYVNGRRESKMHTDGEIWSYGKIIAKIYPDGEIWSGGYKVGKIYSDGEIWVGSKCIAKANDNFMSNNNNQTIMYSENAYFDNHENNNSNGHENNNSPSGYNDSCMTELVCYLIAGLLILSAIFACIAIWPVLLTSAHSTSDYIQIFSILAGVIVTMVIQYRVNRKGKGGYGYFINLAGVMLTTSIVMIIEEGRIEIGSMIFLSCVISGLPTAIVACICWIMGKIRK